VAAATSRSEEFRKGCLLSAATSKPGTREQKRVAEVLSFLRQNHDFAYFNPKKKKVHKHKRFE